MQFAHLIAAALLAMPTASAAQPALTVRVYIPSGLAARTLPVLTTADLEDVETALGARPATGLVVGVEETEGRRREVAGQLDIVGREVRIALLVPSEPAGERLIQIAPQTAAPGAGAALRVTRDGAAVTVSNETYEITHDPARNGGLPSRIVLPQTGKVLESFRFNDRVWAPEVGGFSLSEDPSPEVTVLAAGPLYAAVQVRARYLRDRQAAPGNPHAVYTYSYFAGQPTFQVTAEVAQDDSFRWSELHLWELYFKDDSFGQWVTYSDPLTDFRNDNVTHRGAWGALVDGRNAIGLLGSVIIHDGQKDYGRYLHGPWVSWATPRTTLTIDVWAGAADDPGAELAKAAKASLQVPTGTVYTPRLVGLGTALERRGQREPRLGWMLSLLRGAVEQRVVSLAEAERVAQGMLAGKPGRVLKLGSRALELRQTATLGLAVSTSGAQLVSLYDLRRGRELLAAPSSLFQVEVQDGAGVSRSVESSTLRPVSVGRTADADVLDLRCDLGAADSDLAGIVATVRGTLEGDEVRWTVDVDNPSDRWSLMRVTAPLLKVHTLGDDAGDDRLLAPWGFGRSYPAFAGIPYLGFYPSGWCTMQWMAVTDAESGLYLGFHDPTAAYKLLRSTEIGDAGVPLQFEVPVPDATVPGNDYHPAGEMVMAAVGGGYYPACRLYRAWLERSAPWFPEPGRWGRSDTPQWVRDTQTWVQWGDGYANLTVPPTRAFAEAMGTPTAIHWYCWHEIPFDNQYPHYFPTKPGFREGVAELQAAGVRVMPYINGRLWDKDTEDFSAEARAFCSKQPDGEPYIERYGSGRDLVPMCPSTPFWREKVQGLVLRLVGEEGVDGVYIDQVAAASPALCYDKSHGHPLGGGHWWVDGYAEMLGDLQERIAQVSGGKMLTTESNAEPYMRYFDAYLMCNDDCDYEAPLFPAVYGSKIQTFGAYMSLEDWHDMTLMALRQGRLFAYGAQLWWSNPYVATNAEATKWLHDLAQLRGRVSEFFVRGEMAPPPSFLEEVGMLTTTWGAGEIHTPDLWAATWRLEDGKLLMPLVNLPKAERTFTLQFDPATYGLGAKASVRVERLTGAGVAETVMRQGRFELPVKLGPAEATALVITPQ